MQIIQISDLHISTVSNLNSIINQISLLYKALLATLNKSDSTIICILGDIVDKGDYTNYTKAKDVLNCIRGTFAEFNPTFEFTPGNHDLCNCPHSNPKPEPCSDQKCSLEYYNSFILDFDSSYSPADSVSYKEYDDVGLILANSVFHGNCHYGLIDIDALKNIHLTKPALLVTHHTFLSESETDTAGIRNAYKLFEEIESKAILGVLHGHTHGYKDITINDKCPVIGVGPFLKSIPNINNQANLVIVTSSGIQQVTNYYYRADLSRYDARTLYSRANTVYKGSDIQKLFNVIVSDAKKLGVLPNMNLHINMPYSEFNEQVERFFAEQIPIAALWQDTGKVPDSLYYNHGQFMQYNDVTAINFVINELKCKSTSSRAIIPLINFEKVVKSGDGFLPSFDLIQFGFMEESKTHLWVTLYLRALEVNHFLRINLCEIYLMCKEIAQEIRSIDTIDINILAFKAQYKEHFGCFKRAEIDKINESDIAFSLQGNLDYIIQMLEEKKGLSETVIENKGMTGLFNALNAASRRGLITTVVLEQSEIILETMEQLKLERKKTSNYTSIETLENRLSEQLDKIIHLFKEVKYES